MNLSDRLRPDVEAAPWVIAEVRKLEEDFARLYVEAERIRKEKEAGEAFYKVAIQQRDQAWRELEAQPEQEPVIGTKTWFEDGKVITQYLHPSDIYSTPPQFKPLTDEQIADIAAQGHQRWLEFARAIEAAHNIKE